MERQKRWQLYLIVVVVFLTLYNILPTVFYYSRPLKQSINEPKATQIAASAAQRVNDLESDSIEWLHSFCKLLKVKPVATTFDPKHPQIITLTFKNAAEATRVRTYLPRAGALIPFVPMQMGLYDAPDENAQKSVVVQRRIPLHFDAAQLKTFFQYSSKFDEKGNIAPLYRALINDRALELGLAVGGASENAQYLNALLSNPKDPQSQDFILQLAQNILSCAKVFGEDSAIAQRYFSSFTQVEASNREEMVDGFINSLDHLKDKIKLERIALQEESQKATGEGAAFDPVKQQRLDLLLGREKSLSSAEAIVKKHIHSFASGKAPWNYTNLGSRLEESYLKLEKGSQIQMISLSDRNPFIAKLLIDWGNEKIALVPHDDLIAFRKNLSNAKGGVYLRDRVDQFLYDEIAMISRQAGEEISPFQDEFVIALSKLPGSKSFLAMRLGTIAQALATGIKETLLTTWTPKHADLTRDAFPVYDYETYQNLSADKQKLGLVIYAPSKYNKMPPKGFRMNSVYVIAKGLDKVVQKFNAHSDTPQAQEFFKDFNELRSLMQRYGFYGYPASTLAFGSASAGDFIFEAEDYFQPVVKATREEFQVHGTRRYGVLEFSDVEQRILAENKIGTRKLEDLLKWRDDYRAAQLHLKGATPFDVPAPTKNVYWNNFKLSLAKYFRGDDRKILKWGLDLSGGKTVQIELRDNNNRLVTSEDDIKQGINELYRRVNKMGVSEVSIRQEGNFITLDFPGSQALSAAELVKASSMFFHVVNEKFSPGNPSLGDAASRFLQEVWNEALVTNHKEIDEINTIAWKHLYGDTSETDVVQPRSEAAKTLYDSGLRLANPDQSQTSGLFDDSVSKIAIFRGEDFTEWHGQTNPLLIVFRNYALEGSNLENVHAGYDPSKGNFLSFGVQGNVTSKEGQKHNARDDFYAWTSQFAKEKIGGTPAESYSRGHGWRMAVILNGSVISAPTLDSPLRDSAMISGSFTQREINQLEADLKAGSLSFTPRILSEKNVSPELGGHERFLGICATLLALALIIGVMVSYYRFAGVVACSAVLFNLLILWATLQNLQATLTLAGIAGIILALATAVDANVLVFERIREEFAVSGRLASAVHVGYKKAFSAIIDSNVTTIIAALILLHFDSGPVKGFAVTLIIGIVSSMFTALFLTRYFFAGWVQNPAHKALHMAHWIKASSFNFLKYTKSTVLFSCFVIVIGGFLVFTQRHTILGMDFTGGYALTFEVQAKPNTNYRGEIERALIAGGATSQDFQIRELTPANNIRLFLSRSLEQSGRPFYGIALLNPDKELSYAYQSNPKIVWIVQALEKANLRLTPDSLAHLDKNWTQVSGQISETMRQNAIFGLLLALLCILIYITFRFEFKYAISATICLAHDVIFAVGAIAILHRCGVPLQIDLTIVAALLTIVGYSLNDTIIVFDRIREDIRLMKKATFQEIINHSLNATLSRTLMTSGITLLALLPLVFLGGSTLFGFALVMSIGVVFGTLSSLFIAAPLMLYFHNREVHKQQKLILKPD